MFSRSLAFIVTLAYCLIFNDFMSFKLSNKKRLGCTYLEPSRMLRRLEIFVFCLYIYYESAIIRNAAELYGFVEEAISVIATEDVNCENRNKRLLPTTITAERIKGKKQVIEIGGDEREISPGKVNSRKTLFSQARDNSRLDSTSTEITSVCTLPEQEADDILTSLCNVEDHG